VLKEAEPTALESDSELRSDIRRAIRELCERFPESYWRDLDANRGYPDLFVAAMTEGGFLGGLVPQQYGGLGLGIGDASVILEEVSRSGGNPGAVHGQMYTMGTLLRHGSDAQKRKFLPLIARGEIRLQAFAVTEPTAGSDTTKTRTTAIRYGDGYVVNGQKVFISRAQHSDFMMLLARTTPADEVKRRADGLSVFLVDLRDAGQNLTIKPLRTMMNHHSTEIFFDNLVIPAESLVGEEGAGFRYILDGMNAERILIASECVGDARYFLDRATDYAKTRTVFDRAIGMNQGIQFPLARAYANTEAADLMRWRAATLFDSNRLCGPEANMSKLLAADASWEAANAAMQTFGGYGFAVDYNIERKFRETRLYQVAPVSTNMILSYLGEHVLGLPRSH
jgi:acyl-CoA dehydrogenase